jgi:hypothetical protein
MGPTKVAKKVFESKPEDKIKKAKSRLEWLEGVEWQRANKRESSASVVMEAKVLRAP